MKVWNVSKYFKIDTYQVVNNSDWVDAFSLDADSVAPMLMSGWGHIEW